MGNINLEKLNEAKQIGFEADQLISILKNAKNDIHLERIIKSGIEIRKDSQAANLEQLVNIFVNHPHLNIDHIAKALTIGIEENEIKAIKNNYDLLKKMKEKNIKNEENDINFEFEGKLSHFQRAVKVHKISQKEVNSFSYENPRIDYDATAKALNI